MHRRWQGLFVLAGLALLIAGLNGSRPLVIVGGALLFLGLIARFLKVKSG